MAKKKSGKKSSTPIEHQKTLKISKHIVECSVLNHILQYCPPTTEMFNLRIVCRAFAQQVSEHLKECKEFYALPRVGHFFEIAQPKYRRIATCCPNLTDLYMPASALRFSNMDHTLQSFKQLDRLHVFPCENDANLEVSWRKVPASVDAVLYGFHVQPYNFLNNLKTMFFYGYVTDKRAVSVKAKVEHLQDILNEEACLRFMDYFADFNLDMQYLLSKELPLFEFLMVHHPDSEKLWRFALGRTFLTMEKVANLILVKQCTAKHVKWMITACMKDYCFSSTILEMLTAAKHPQALPICQLLIAEKKVKFIDYYSWMNSAVQNMNLLLVKYIASISQEWFIDSKHQMAQTMLFNTGDSELLDIFFNKTYATEMNAEELLRIAMNSKKKLEALKYVFAKMSYKQKAALSMLSAGVLEQLQNFFFIDENNEILSLFAEHLGEAFICQDDSQLLHLAVQYDRMPAVQLLIEKGYRVDKRDELDRTALNCGPSLEIAKLLIDSGADINSQDKVGQVPLMKMHYDCSSIVDTYKHLIDFLVIDVTGNSLLHQCSHDNVLNGYLQYEPQMIDMLVTPNDNGVMPLQLLGKQSPQMLEILAAYVPKLWTYPMSDTLDFLSFVCMNAVHNAVTAFKMCKEYPLTENKLCPLHYAILDNVEYWSSHDLDELLNTALAKSMINHPGVYNGKMYTPFMLGFAFEEYLTTANILKFVKAGGKCVGDETFAQHMVVSNNCKDLLDDMAAGLNVTIADIMPSLKKQVAYDDDKLLQLLQAIMAKTPFEAKDVVTMDTIHPCIVKMRYDILNYYLIKFACRDLFLSIRDSNNNTMLHTLITYCPGRIHVDALRFIFAVDFSPIVNAKNSSGNTALHFAASGGLVSVVNGLREIGAEITIENNAGKSPIFMSNDDGIINALSSTKKRKSVKEYVDKYDKKGVSHFSMNEENSSEEEPEDPKDAENFAPEDADDYEKLQPARKKRRRG